jgi:type IV secretory pathway VirB2 component (pilin)
MAKVQIAVRVRGRPSDATAAASQEGLEVAVEPVRTVLRGPVPDQAALLGILTKARLLGLELIEVRRQPSADQG